MPRPTCMWTCLPSGKWITECGKHYRRSQPGIGKHTWTHCPNCGKPILYYEMEVVA